MFLFDLNKKTLTVSFFPLSHHRCAEPAPEGIFANFSLLLTEDPVVEPDVIDLGTIYAEEEIAAKAAAMKTTATQISTGTTACT
jgi:hypothetical protein